MKMPARKTGADRKREIEKVALELAYLHSPGNVSTGMIASRLGLTQPAIYKHFRRKEDIWCAVSNSLAKKIRENITLAAEARMTPVSNLKQLVLAHLALAAQNPAMPELMTMRGDAPGLAAFQKPILKAMAAFRQELEVLVSRAVDAKVFRENLDAQDAALLIMGLIQSLVLRMLVKRNSEILQKDGARLLDLLLTGFMHTGEEK